MAGDTKPAPHYYGGQAVIEGVMMRGRSTWAVAVRRPNNDIYVECNDVKGLASKYALFRRPIFRGIAALGEALSIGIRALTTAANQSLEEEEKLTPKQIAVSMTFAFGFFIGVFIILPALATNESLLERLFGDLPIIAQRALEGAFRLVLFLGYLVLISFMKDIRRVFMYHGAEHKTIAAYEANEPELNVTAVDKYSTIHVRCGTNFLIMVMILTVIIYSFFPRWDLWLRLLSRVIAIPFIAGISYEGLRLGAARLNNPIVKVLMTPGLWLQKITTRQPTPDQIEVAIRAFEAVLPEEERRIVAPLPSPVVERESELASSNGSGGHGATALGGPIVVEPAIADPQAPES